MVTLPAAHGRQYAMILGVLRRPAHVDEDRGDRGRARVESPVLVWLSAALVGRDHDEPTQENADDAN